jgi:hypothetical protein
MRGPSAGCELHPDAHSYGEVPFGGSEAKSDAHIPWGPATEVTIPGAGFRIRGYLDRLDISDDACPDSSSIFALAG